MPLLLAGQLTTVTYQDEGCVKMCFREDSEVDPLLLAGQETAKEFLERKLSVKNKLHKIGVNTRETLM